MKYTTIKNGWLIRKRNGFIGRVEHKKKAGCMLVDGKDIDILTSLEPFDVMSTEPVYTQEEDLQSYAMRKAEEHGFKLLHLKKGRDGTSKHQQADWADCIVFASEGRAFFIELKTGTDLSEGQLEFKQWAVDMGYPHYVARCPADVDEIYEGYV